MKNVHLKEFTARSAQTFRKVKEFFRTPGHEEPEFRRPHVLFSGTVATMAVLATLMLFKTETAYAQKPIAIHDGTTGTRYDMWLPLTDVYGNPQMFRVREWASTVNTPSLRLGARDTTITTRNDTTINDAKDTLITQKTDTAISPRPGEIYVTGIGVVGDVGAPNVPGTSKFNKVGFTGHLKWDRFSLAYGHKWITSNVEAFYLQMGSRLIKIVNEQTLREQDFSGQFIFEQTRGKPPVLGFLRKFQFDGTRFNALGNRDSYNVWRVKIGLPAGFGVESKYDTRPPKEGAPNGTFSLGASKAWSWNRGEYVIAPGGGYTLGVHAGFAEFFAKIGPFMLVLAHERDPGETEAQNSTHGIIILDLADAYNRLLGSEDAPHGGHK